MIILNIITYLSISGSLSKLWPSLFFSEFFVDIATVQHKINSVESSTGCLSVVSSGTCWLDTRYEYANSTEGFRSSHSPEELNIGHPIAYILSCPR